MNLSSSRFAVLGLSLSLATSLLGCGDEVSSDEQARVAYLGLDGAIEKSLALGFAGFNAASSANIPQQADTGDMAGTLTITGQVDQGASANKGMRLRVGMVDYADGFVQLPEDTQLLQINYDTALDLSQQPELTLSLRDIPDGTFTGTLVGTFQMEGSLEGDVTLDLTMSGVIEDDGTGLVRRKAGTTTVKGTAVSDGDTYEVDVTL